MILLASCHTPQDITYFQDATTGTVINPDKVLDIKVRPEDKLSILVSTQDPALSSLFNLVQSQSRISSGSVSVGNAASSDGRTSFYTVDSMGDINFPVLGKLHIAGMKREEVAEYIQKKLIESDMVKQPIVTVEFVNTGVSVLGEVNHPGKFEFNEDRITLIEALAMAGDMKVTGRRDNVKVIRSDNAGRQQTYIVDITDMSELAQSPVYYLQQRDIIYVEPNDKSKRDTTAAGNTMFTPSFWVSLGSIGIAIVTLISTLTR